MSIDWKEKALEICSVLYDKKGMDIVAVRVADKTIIADWFVICTGRVPAQVKTLADELEDRADAMGLELRRKEGYNEGRWIGLDFAGILVHLFVPEERKYYNLERLWLDDDGSNVVFYSREQDQKFESQH